MESPARSRRRIPSLLVVVALVASSTASAAASGPATSVTREPSRQLTETAPRPVDAGGGPAARRADRPLRSTREITRATVPAELAARIATASVTRGSIAVPAAPVKTESKATGKTPTTRASSGGSTPRATAYRGTNHVWIPALGVSRAVYFFPCNRNTALGHVVYRWGCAGRNNVYLMGHASSVFRPLHNAYLSGRLRKGMKVIYADGNGRVRTYAVTFWRVVRPDGDVAWAYAAQSRPSMTLQTCVGSNSAYRLVVRLVAVG